MDPQPQVMEEIKPGVAELPKEEPASTGDLPPEVPENTSQPETTTQVVPNDEKETILQNLRTKVSERKALLAAATRPGSSETSDERSELRKQEVDAQKELQEALLDTLPELREIIDYNTEKLAPLKAKKAKIAVEQSEKIKALCSNEDFKQRFRQLGFSFADFINVNGIKNDNLKKLLAPLFEGVGSSPAAGAADVGAAGAENAGVPAGNSAEGGVDPEKDKDVKKTKVYLNRLTIILRDIPKDDDNFNVSKIIQYKLSLDRRLQFLKEGFLKDGNGNILTEPDGSYTQPSRADKEIWGQFDRNEGTAIDHIVEAETYIKKLAEQEVERRKNWETYNTFNKRVSYAGSWEEILGILGETEKIFIRVQHEDKRKGAYLIEEKSDKETQARRISAVRELTDKKLSPYNLNKFVYEDEKGLEGAVAKIKRTIHEDGAFALITPGFGIKRRVEELIERDIKEGFGVWKRSLPEKPEPKNKPEDEKKEGTEHYSLLRNTIPGDPLSKSFTKFVLKQSAEKIAEEIKIITENIQRLEKMKLLKADAVGIEKRSRLEKSKQALEILTAAKEYLEASEEDKAEKKFDLLNKRLELQQNRLKQKLVEVGDGTKAVKEVVDEIKAL